MSRLLLSLAAFLATGLAFADPSVTGRYNLRISEDAARIARLSGSGEAHGWLTLHVGGRFLLETEKSVRHGDYRIEAGRLILRAEDGEVLRGDIDDEKVSLGGLVFDRPGVRHETVVVRTLEPIAPLPSIEHTRSTPVFAAPAPAIAKAAPRLFASDLTGVWTVWRDGVEQKDERMNLREDGTFHFAMKGASSEGTWTVERGLIILLYAKADGQPLEEGASGRKEIPVADDASAFRIDTYRYERASGR